LQVYDDAAENTANILSESWMCWANEQAALSPTDVLRPTATSISSSQMYKISEQRKALAAAGLDSSLLCPFTEDLSEFNEHDNEFVPSTTTPLEPFSEEYHQARTKTLALDSPKYAHEDKDILHEFEHLLRQYSIAFLLSGSPLGEIHGFEHHRGEDALPVYKHPYCKSPEELLAVKNEIQHMLKMKIIQPSKSEWGAPCIRVRKPLENGIQQPPRFVVDYRGLNSVT